MNKEKPILFSTPMVQAILAGRKTMTRTPIKHQPDKSAQFMRISCGRACFETDIDMWNMMLPCKPGDVLWVRETWRVGAWDDEGSICVDYKADGFVRRKWIKISDYNLYEELWQQSSDDAREANATIDEDGSYTWLPGQAPTRWRSPFTMTREVARLFLRVTDVRVERVQEITAADAVREGVARGWGLNNVECLAGGCYNGDFDQSCALCDVPVEGFRQLWDGINAPRGYGWDTNPWVWVIEFERVDKP